MVRRPSHRQPHDAGFTLVELLVVMIVLGVLAAIAIPAFVSQRNHAWDARAEADLNTATLSLRSYWQFTEPSAMPVDQAVMQAYEPSVTWLGSYGADTSNPPVGAVAFERAQGGSLNTAVLGVRSRSQRCFYVRIVEDTSMSPTGVTYLSRSGPCPDPWDLSSQITRSTY